MLKKLENGEERVVMKFHPALAPVKVAVLPLVKKDELSAVAQKIMDELKFDFNCQYEEKDTIGKRYRRQDAIGTPFCVTVDFDTLNDNAVTLRERDSMKQERVPIEKIHEIVAQKVSMKRLLEQLK
jgi:glycyl-tRNA synthetase